MAEKETKKKTVWERNNIPALEFCTLPRAADLLECETTDLVHLADIGAIEICLRLRNFKATLAIWDMWESGNEWEEDFPPRIEGAYKNRSQLSMFMPVATFDMSPGVTERVKRQYHNEGMPGLKSPLLILSGLWSISTNSLPSSFFNALNNGEEAVLYPYDVTLKEADIPFNIRKFGEYGSDNYVMLAHALIDHRYQLGVLDKSKIQSITSVKANDIFITRQQIELVDSYIGKEIPNYINGGVIRPQEEARSIEKPVKVTAKQSDLIVALLRAIGLTDEELKGSVSELMNKANIRASQLRGKRVEPLPFPDDEASTISWLKKGGVSR